MVWWLGLRCRDAPAVARDMDRGNGSICIVEEERIYLFNNYELFINVISFIAQYHYTVQYLTHLSTSLTPSLLSP
jgi:hypothetical protein